MRITISLALGGGVAHHQEGLTEVRYIVKHVDASVINSVRTCNLTLYLLIGFLLSP